MWEVEEEDCQNEVGKEERQDAKGKMEKKGLGSDGLGMVKAGRGESFTVPIPLPFSLSIEHFLTLLAVTSQFPLISWDFFDFY